MSMNASFVSRWDVLIHERGHFLHVVGGSGMYGQTYTYKIFDVQKEANTTLQKYYVYRMTKTAVTYLADKFTPCDEDDEDDEDDDDDDDHDDDDEDDDDKVDINDCVQEWIQTNMGCRLPWLMRGNLPDCSTTTQSEQYFM